MESIFYYELEALEKKASLSSDHSSETDSDSSSASSEGSHHKKGSKRRSKKNNQSSLSQELRQMSIKEDPINRAKHYHLQLNFLEEGSQNNQFFKLQCAKLVQANTILTQIVKQTALEKYHLEEKVFKVQTHIRALYQKKIKSEEQKS